MVVLILIKTQLIQLILIRNNEILIKIDINYSLNLKLILINDK